MLIEGVESRLDVVLLDVDVRDLPRNRHGVGLEVQVSIQDAEYDCESAYGGVAHARRVCGIQRRVVVQFQLRSEIELSESRPQRTKPSPFSQCCDQCIWRSSTASRNWRRVRSHDNFDSWIKPGRASPRRMLKGSCFVLCLAMSSPSR